MKYNGIDATRHIAESLDVERTVVLGGLAIQKIRSVEVHGHNILVSGILADSRPILFRYGIDDEPVIVPTIQLLGTAQI